MSQAGQAGLGSSGSRIITNISTFNPNAVVQEFDDFFGLPAASAAFSKLQWQSITPTIISAIAGTANNPGIYNFKANTPGLNVVFFQQTTDSLGFTGGPVALGGGQLSITWIIQLPTLSGGGNTYQFSCGMADGNTLGTNSSDSYINGVYFMYTDSVNGGNWRLKSTSASVTTTVNTATAATTNFVSLSISVNANASTVTYYINGTSVGTISTNIPLTSLSPFIFAKNTAGTTPAFNADLFYITQVLSTPRPGLSNTNVITGTGMLIEQYKQTGVSYQVLPTDAIIGCTAGSITITLPATPTATGQRFTIKDEAGVAAGSNITVSGNGKNIDNAATALINTNFGALDIYYNGTKFFIV